MCRLNQAASVGRRLERCLQLVEEGGGSPMSCAASNAVSREAQQEWEIRQLRAEIRQLRQQLAPQVQAVAPVPAVHQPQQQQPAWPAPQHAVGHPPPQAAAPVAVLPTVHEMIVQLANNHPDLIEYGAWRGVCACVCACVAAACVEYRGLLLSSTLNHNWPPWVQRRT